MVECAPSAHPAAGGKEGLVAIRHFGDASFAELVEESGLIRTGMGGG